MSPKTWTTVAFSILLVPAGCQTMSGGCPPLVKYSVPQQQAAAKELLALHKGAQLGTMIVDYKKMRDACRI